MRRFYAYITFLVFITMIVTAISFSRYAHTITGQSNTQVASVVVAQVPVSAYLKGEPLTGIESGINASDMLPGDELVYNFNIVNYDGSNTNQVKVKYNVSVAYTPSDPMLLPLSESLTANGTYPSAGGGWTYLGFGSQITHSYTLTITWDENLIDPSYKSLTQNINIVINVEQVD